MTKIRFVLICFLLFLIYPAITANGEVGYLNEKHVAYYKQLIIESRDIRSDRQIIKRNNLLNQIKQKGLVDSKIKNMNKQLQDSTLCLALNIYHEARNSSIEDMIGVSLTVFSRLIDGQYVNAKVSNNLCNVIFADNQYSWTSNENNLPREKKAWKLSQSIAYTMVSDRDILFNVKDLHYKHYVERKLYNSTSNSWYNKATHIRTIGKHIYLVFEPVNDIDETNKANTTITYIKGRLFSRS